LLIIVKALLYYYGKESRSQENRGERGRGRLRMRWEDCVKRELERVGEYAEQQHKIEEVGDCQ